MAPCNMPLIQFCKTPWKQQLHLLQAASWAVQSAFSQRQGSQQPFFSDVLVIVPITVAISVSPAVLFQQEDDQRVPIVAFKNLFSQCAQCLLLAFQIHIQVFSTLPSALEPGSATGPLLPYFWQGFSSGEFWAEMQERWITGSGIYSPNSLPKGSSGVG